MDPLLNLKLHSSSFAMPASVIWILPAFLIYLTCMTDVTLRSTSGAVFFFFFFPSWENSSHYTVVILSVFDHHSLFAISPDPFLKKFFYFPIKLTSPKRKIFPLLKTSLWWLILCVNLTNIITNNNKKVQQHSEEILKDMFYK